MLRFQEPRATGGHLLEALLEASDGAKAGGAIFAFATKAGVDLLFDKKAAFTRFLNRAERFRLVVGVDAITSSAALDALAAVSASALEARVFMHRQPQLFHPKLAWFKRRAGFRLVIGSGNLTLGGLKSNWEAFSVVDLRGLEASRAELELDRWFTRWDSALHTVDDPDVRRRAAHNKGRERDLQGSVPDDTGVRLETDEYRSYDAREPVLIAEISKGGSRPSQANFHLRHFELYFGAKKGIKRQIILNRVGTDGVLHGLELRDSVEVKSRNYRFELAAAFGGRAYPAKGRPIAAFVRTAGGTVPLHRGRAPADDPQQSLAAREPELTARLFTGCTR